QKSYADVRRKPLEFNVGDMVMLKVSPWKGVIRFGKRGTPLVWAAGHAQQDAVKLLLKHKADAHSHAWKKLLKLNQGQMLF
ncbi:putative reverse transcriptase domain-containing protein, partial [Tanacetum coccineum]